MSDYANHVQLYTHSEKLGIIKGQVWSRGHQRLEILAITGAGKIILGYRYKLAVPLKIPLYEFIREWELVNTVGILPFVQPTSPNVLRYQIVVPDPITKKLIVLGELGNNIDDCYWPHPHES